MKTVFFGTPEFAVPTLRAMTENGYRPDLVVTQPARPVGRGRKLQDPPVAVWARANGLDVRQPEKVKEAAFMEEMAALEPDVAVVVAFGQIFRRSLLELPKHGCINVHASLLPLYRGAAPIQAAIAEGDAVTGVTTMKMDVGLDSGPMLLKAELEIGPTETSAELAPRLAELGADLLVETLNALAAGTLSEEAQDADQATFAPRLTKADGQVDWQLPAETIYNRLRAFTPWPGQATVLDEKPLKILANQALSTEPDFNLPDGIEDLPGTFLGQVNGLLAVRCAPGTVLGLERVQRPGKKPVDATDLMNAERLQPGTRFGPA